jgi:hypothetical protein
MNQVWSARRRLMDRQSQRERKRIERITSSRRKEQSGDFKIKMKYSREATFTRTD